MIVENLYLDVHKLGISVEGVIIVTEVQHVSVSSC